MTSIDLAQENRKKYVQLRRKVMALKAHQQHKRRKIKRRKKEEGEKVKKEMAQSQFSAFLPFSHNRSEKRR